MELLLAAGMLSVVIVAAFWIYGISGRTWTRASAHNRLLTTTTTFGVKMRAEVRRAYKPGIGYGDASLWRQDSVFVFEPDETITSSLCNYSGDALGIHADVDGDGDPELEVFRLDGTNLKYRIYEPDPRTGAQQYNYTYDTDTTTAGIQWSPNLWTILIPGVVPAGISTPGFSPASTNRLFRVLIMDNSQRAYQRRKAICSYTATAGDAPSFTVPGSVVSMSRSK